MSSRISSRNGTELIKFVKFIFNELVHKKSQYLNETFIHSFLLASVTEKKITFKTRKSLKCFPLTRDFSAHFAQRKSKKFDRKSFDENALAMMNDE